VNKMGELLNEYGKRKEIIKLRLEDFKKIKSDDLFYELCFCLLTPQSRAKQCWNSVLALKARNFYENNLDPVKYIEGVRFQNNKGKYLIEAKQVFLKILGKINNSASGEEFREWLVENLKGYGLKEASHFLRNIGYRNLAILDRHILKNLRKYGVIEEIPKTLTKAKYFEIEKKFKDFSEKIGIDMDELDLLFWSMETGEVFK